MIVEAIRKHFRVQLKPIDRPIYKKSYPEWVNKMMPLLKGYKVLDSPPFQEMTNPPWSMLIKLSPSLGK